ncbi:uncharacterized protein LOC114131366 isoform X2 [Aphis gossypii]|uniref:Uncharacterized protein n=1 Tax=Aphis gossypii TaxID=80765 RepID=A0A9P0J381_APHGO|nr:uncharacterized protein LOC114131366 isoform X2 [Aphis gossypii]CAH1724098.1 unnamed protein product [Aphis gossypii]
MISKHIVLSMIVIGCLVQFITCPSSTGNDTPNRQNSARTFPSNNNLQRNPPLGSKKLEARPTMKTGAQPRGLQNENPKNNGPLKDPKPLAKKPTGSKNLEASTNKNKNNGGIPENEDLDEQNPPGRIRRTISLLNGFRKKFNPFRLLFKAAKKTKELGTNMLGSVKITKPNSTNDNDADDST